MNEELKDKLDEIRFLTDQIRGTEEMIEVFSDMESVVAARIYVERQRLSWSGPRFNECVYEIKRSNVAAMLSYLRNYLEETQAKLQKLVV